MIDALTRDVSILLFSGGLDIVFAILLLKAYIEIKKLKNPGGVV